MDLSSQLEKAIPEGPDLPDAGARLEAGRAALRRRRLALGAGVLAALLVPAIAVGAALVDRASAPDVADPPRRGAGQALVQEDDPVGYDEFGKLRIASGVVVHERVRNPYGLAPPRRSDAFDFTYRGEREWAVLRTTRQGWTSATAGPGLGWLTFADFVADTVDPGPDARRWPDTIRLDDAGEVVADGGSEILERTDDPRLGDGFAPPGTPTGAALVRAARDGADYFVMWRVVDGELDVVHVPPRGVGDDTFAELVDAARDAVADKEQAG